MQWGIIQSDVRWGQGDCLNWWKVQEGGTTGTFVTISLVRIYVQTNQCRMRSPIKGHSFKFPGSESFSGVFMSHFSHCRRFDFSGHENQQQTSKIFAFTVRGQLFLWLIFIGTLKTEPFHSFVPQRNKLCGSQQGSSLVNKQNKLF